jgi:glycosyltransferase involved in cell wall biosynthesis
MSPQIVVLGMLAKMPVPGVVWQTLHYLLGFRALGFDVLYVEAHGRTPSMLMERDTDDGSARAGALIDSILRPFGLGGSWAFHALHDDGRVLGMSEAGLRAALRDAELIINLHGGTMPTEELAASGRLVYLETDPVALQIELHDGDPGAHAFLEPHCAFFTFAENLGSPECPLPTSERFPFRPTRQPVVLSLWENAFQPPADRFTTIANWRQGWRTVRFGGETYGWSKDEEWQQFLELPARTGAGFEVALSGFGPRDDELLSGHGWVVRPALDLSQEDYRDFIRQSGAEFTVAKDQNVRLATGWFSDRSATYLAAGRPVVTQDTGFGTVLPVGEGLFPVRDLDEAVAAVGEITADPERHRRAAAAVAREHFDAERVLGALLDDLGVRTPARRRTTTMDTSALTRATERVPSLHRDCTVLALIPHFECEEYLDDTLASLTAQTRPLDGIVVIDDHSGEPPLDIVRRHPGVTLLRSDQNVGPYRLVQQVIDDTDYDAYLFQDADDWSAPDRLERLLEHAEREGADMIGSQEVRIFCDEPQAIPIQWPLDGNEPFQERATAFPLLHPTTLVSRALLKAAGGFSSGLRFGGDAEFLRRAHYVGRCVNVPHHGYFRRVRRGSLTTAPATAIGTPARKELMEETFARANANAEAVARGEQPDLTPLRTGPRVGLERLAGPRLHTEGSGDRPPRPAPPQPYPAEDGPPAPVFVVGTDHAGAGVLACALGQHPALPQVHDAGWLGALVAQLRGVRGRALAGDDRAFGVDVPDETQLIEAFGAASAALAAGGSRRWVANAWQLASDIPGLLALFPDAKVIHVVRDVHASVRALTDPPLGAPGATGGTQVPPRLRAGVPEAEAVERWTTTVEHGLAAQRELGHERMLTISHADLLAEPEQTLRRCLTFAGEPFGAECMRPLRELRNMIDATPLEPDVDAELWQRAVAAEQEAWSAVEQSLRNVEALGGGRRIVMVTDHFPKVSETFFVRKFLGLLSRGWDVHVVCQRSNDEHWAFFPELREQIRHQQRLHVAGDGVEAAISALRPDLVHFGYGTLACDRMHVRDATGCRVVVSFRGYDLNSFRVDDPTAYDDVWRRADALHVVSESIWRRAQERGCPPDREHRVIVDAVDARWFTPPATRDEHVGTAERPLRLLSVGRLHWKKGHDQALAAVRELVDRGIAVDYRIVGDGEHLEPTSFAIDDLGLRDSVQLLGARPGEEVRDLLAWADAFVHPSLTEAFGVAVIEAQAMGLPVVCTDAGGLPENVGHEITGFVVPRRDPRAMAERLAQLAGDAALRRRMGRAARLRAETALDLAHQLDAFEDLYRGLLAEPRPAGDGLDEARDAAGQRRVEELRRELADIQRRWDALREQLWRREVVERVQAFVGESLPDGAHVLVVSRGDEEVVRFAGRHGHHFPQTDEGEYLGHHPANSTDAIAHLESLRARGAEYLLVPATSGWWLEHYGELAAHLERDHELVASEDGFLVCFALCEPASVEAQV